MKFKLNSPYKPAGDQPKAIEKLVEGVHKQAKDQVLLGVTGSGKTYTKLLKKQASLPLF